MATATLPHSITAELESATTTAWWRRGHSYSLPVVITAQIAACWLAIKVAESGSWRSPASEILTAAMIGFLIAQCFLLGAWAALGGLPTVVRWLTVGLVYVVGATVIAQPLFDGNWESFLEVAPEFILLGGILMTIFAAILLPLRRLAAWRIDFDAVYHSRTNGPRGQLAMMDFAAMFCAVALPLSLIRVLMETSPEDGAGILLFMGLFALLVVVAAAPAGFAVLARRRIAFWWLAAAAWIVALAWGQSLLARYVPDFDLFDTSAGIAGLRWGMLAFYGGIAGAVTVPLFSLRLCGLKLITLERADRHTAKG